MSRSFKKLNIVYVFYNNNTPLYIGKSVNFDARYKQHQYKAKWFNKFNRIEIAIVDNYSLLEFYEIYYICKLKPKYNKRHKNNSIDLNLPELTFNDVTTDVYGTVRKNKYNVNSSISIPPELKDRLRTAAKKHSYTTKDIITSALDLLLTKLEFNNSIISGLNNIEPSSKAILVEIYCILNEKEDTSVFTLEELSDQLRWDNKDTKKYIKPLIEMGHIKEEKERNCYTFVNIAELNLVKRTKTR